MSSVQGLTTTCLEVEYFPLLARLYYRLADSKVDHVVRGDVVIGRSSQADLLLDDPHASRVHAKIIRKGGEYFVRDLGSKLGTRLNGMVVVGEMKLRDKDEITVGDTVLTFLLDSDDMVVTAAQSYNRVATFSMVIVSALAFLSMAILTREIVRMILR
jgi:pSer/pThr/pTyr-binding forkhead associated (FHA) protein